VYNFFTLNIMPEIVQNPDGSYSFGRYDRDDDIREEIVARVELAEEEAKTSTEKKMRLHWDKNIAPLYLELKVKFKNDDDTYEDGREFLEEILDNTPKRAAKIQEELEAMRLARLAEKNKSLRGKKYGKVVKSVSELVDFLVSLGWSKESAKEYVVGSRLRSKLSKKEGVFVFSPAGKSFILNDVEE